MTTRILHIDGAAFAYTRLRFIRALIASGFASIVFFAILFPIVIAPNAHLVVDPSGPFSHGGVVMLAVGVASFLSVIGIVGLSLTLTQLRLLNRRIVAALSLYPIVLFSLGTLVRNGLVVGGADVGFGYVLTYLASATILLVLFVEMTPYAIWATCASNLSYPSIRGWRPPWRHLVGNLEEQLGFPAFAAFFSRGRLQLAALFLAMAALNSYFFGILTWTYWAPHAGRSGSRYARATRY